MKTGFGIPNNQGLNDPAELKNIGAAIISRLFPKDSKKQQTTVAVAG